MWSARVAVHWRTTSGNKVNKSVWQSILWFSLIFTCVIILKQLFASGSANISEYLPRLRLGTYSPIHSLSLRRIIVKYYRQYTRKIAVLKTREKGNKMTFGGILFICARVVNSEFWLQLSSLRFLFVHVNSIVWIVCHSFFQNLPKHRNSHAKQWGWRLIGPWKSDDGFLANEKKGSKNICGPLSRVWPAIRAHF